MIESILLVEGTNVDEDALRSRSLSNAKQLVFGRFGQGHGVPGVKTVVTLALRK